MWPFFAYANYYYYYYYYYFQLESLSLGCSPQMAHLSADLQGCKWRIIHWIGSFKNFSLAFAPIVDIFGEFVYLE
jgi:hypothetical protein